MILVVDDERSVRDATRLLLERSQFRVLTAIHGEDALVQYLQHRSDIKLVITDVMMPVMNGVALVRTLRVINPTLKILAASGLGEAAHGRELAEYGVTEVLHKPYSGETLLEVVQRQLAGDLMAT